MRMSEPQSQGRANNNFRVFGRMKPGVAIDAANAEFVNMAAGIAEEFPEDKMDWSARLVPLQNVLVGGVRGVLWVLLGAVGLVLLIACANVAALLLARAAARQGEVAVRVAMGASRGRIGRQMLTESVVIALFGGALGLGVAYWALKALASFAAGSLPGQTTIELDGTALIFTLIVSVATGILFGLAPAIRAPKLRVVEALKEGHRGMRGAGGLGMQRQLVIGQVALSLILLITSGLLMKSFMRLQQEEMGFQPQGVLTATVRLPQITYGEERHPYQFYQAALERVSALPGVEAAGVITALPVVGGFGPWNYAHAEGRPPATQADRKGVVRRVASPDYFAAMGIPLMRGRTFRDSDAADAPRVAIISRGMAEEFFPGEDPIGRSVVYPWDPDVYFEVVGIVGDVRLGPLQMDTRPTIYWSATQNGRLSSRIVLRTSGEPLALASALRAAIGAVDPNVPVSSIQPMTAVVSSSLAQNRFRTTLLGAFAVVAVLLAALGLYGVLAQMVGRRTHELGVRIALGADRSNILAWVIRHGLKLAGIGLVFGLVGAALVTQAVRGMLFGVQPIDASTYGITVIVLGLVALAAALIPAWRATRVDPVECLRSE
jgi:putative ABC transport system permease protein